MIEGLNSSASTQNETAEQTIAEEITDAIMSRVGYSVEVMVPEALSAEVHGIVQDSLLVAYNAGYAQAVENLSKGKEEL